MTKRDERLRHYGRKGEQHLNRVLLSHLFAIEAVRQPEVWADERLIRLLQESFDMRGRDEGNRLRRGFRDAHLLALKAEFELFLARMCSVLNIEPKWSNLESLTTQLKKHCGVDLATLHNWPQIRVAFALRNLIEHHDGKVDAKFMKTVREGSLDYWTHSSWSRHGGPELGKKVALDEEDLEKTHSAMMEMCRSITERLLSES